MISVIIPTMWRPKRFLETLKELEAEPIVGEIILIDNTPNKNLITGFKKLVHILEGKNTYVNRAWNKGARIAKYDKLCIMNDDIWFDTRIMEILYPYITPENGMIIMDRYNYAVPKKELALQKTDKTNFGGGCLFFIHKSRWIEIPEGVKIWKGDDWLFYKNGGQNYKLEGFKIDGTIGETSNLPEFKEIIERDAEFFRKNNNY